MSKYRRFTLPLALIGGAVATSAAAFALLRAIRLRSRKAGRQKALLDNWEAEGGSLSATEPGAP